jgi:hypothetical protein
MTNTTATAVTLLDDLAKWESHVRRYDVKGACNPLANTLQQAREALRAQTTGAEPAEVNLPQTVADAPIWNSIQIASWIGSQLMHEPAMFERATVCKFVRSLGRHPTLLKHSPKDPL